MVGGHSSGLLRGACWEALQRSIRSSSVDKGWEKWPPAAGKNMEQWQLPRRRPPRKTWGGWACPAPGKLSCSPLDCITCAAPPAFSAAGGAILPPTAPQVQASHQRPGQNAEGLRAICPQQGTGDRQTLSVPALAESLQGAGPTCLKGSSSPCVSVALQGDGTGARFSVWCISIFCNFVQTLCVREFQRRVWPFLIQPSLVSQKNRAAGQAWGGGGRSWHTPAFWAARDGLGGKQEAQAQKQDTPVHRGLRGAPSRPGFHSFGLPSIVSQTCQRPAHPLPG